MALTDEELNAAVFAIIYPESPQPVTVPAGKRLEVVTRIRVMGDWAHDIAAAWELIDGAVESAVFFPGGDDVEMDVWARMTFIDRDTGPRSGDCPGGLSAARAITRAFVLAMSGGFNESK